MKPCLLFIAFLITTALSAQTGKTFLYGKVSLSSTRVALFPAYSSLAYKEYTSAENWRLSSISIEANGNFHYWLPKNTKIELLTYVKDFYTSDTVIYTGSMDSLEVNITIHPKVYAFTSESAKADLANGMVRLVIFDSLIYHWNHKIHFTNRFGFEYHLIDKPEDIEVGEKIEAYNSTVVQYLDSLQGDAWQRAIHVISDSLTHLEADNYGKTHRLNLKALAFPVSAELPAMMVERLEEQSGDFKRLLVKKGAAAPTFTPEFMLDKIDNDPDYHFQFVAELCTGTHYNIMVPELVKRITDKKYVGLTNSADLIIWERIKSGDLKFYGHGGAVNNDLFTVAGRANHLLQRTTGMDFGTVSMHSTAADLQVLQNRWAYWLMNLGK